MLRIFEREKIFHFCTDKVSYLFHIENNSVRNIYWGKTIDGADAASLLTLASHSSFDGDVRAEREEYALWNGRGFHLPCLQAHSETGRAVFCAYKGYEKYVNEETDRLDLLLEDKNLGLQIRLCYLLYRDIGIIARRVIFTACEHKVTLDRVMSAAVSLPAGQKSKARWLTGKWAGEFRIQESPVNTGVMTIQSKRGITGHHFNPAIALAEPSAGENNGCVWFGALAYSGNWSIQVEKTIFGNTHIAAGINDFDFEMTLNPGESFETPDFYCGFTDGGFGAMSRIMHRFVREKIMPYGEPALRPVLYNSWEATAFNVQAEEQKKLAQRAARIGCELFVVDDGWFGERHSDTAGLGDWQVNAKKFPNGLGELADYVTGLGMRFGIWVEPESVSPDSDLYRAHPDWIYRYPNQEPVQLRSQYLLNMSLPQVRAYLKKMLYDLLSGSNITFVKWDMNRVITDPQSADGKGKTLWYSHVKAVYSLWEYVREYFPHVEMETCAGGGRIDLGILSYAEQCWPSDNTDPYTRLFIQEGYSQFYPAIAMMCWVTDSPGGGERAQRPLTYRFHSAMCGGLGIGSDITKFSEKELEECAGMVKQYKEWRHIIQLGELYRLLSPREGNVTALEYVAQSGEEILLFVFINGMTTDESISPVRLRGLEANAYYHLDSGAKLAGSTLMNAGLRLSLTGDFASSAVYLKKCAV